MIVISHEHVAVHDEAAPPTDLGKRRKKHLPVLVIAKYRFPPVPQAHHMIEGALKLNANSSRHPSFQSPHAQRVKVILHLCTD
jgi:hypothetical protein